MKSILVDTNVALDVFLSRSPWDVEAEAIIQAGFDGKINLFLSAFSVPTIFNVVRRQLAPIKAHLVVKMCLDNYQMIQTDRALMEVAANMPATDFEDNIQIASAMSFSLDALVTRDPKGFGQSQVPAYSPADLLIEINRLNP